MKKLTDGAASAPFSEVARERLTNDIAAYLKHLGTERRLSVEFYEVPVHTVS